MESSLGLGFLAYFAGINLLAYGLYGLDKYKAQRETWRISEAALLLTAFAGGCVGAAAGMAHFHHKTRKIKFRVSIPLALALWIGILAFFVLPLADLP